MYLDIKKTYKNSIMKFLNKKFLQKKTTRYVNFEIIKI